MYLLDSVLLVLSTLVWTTFGVSLSNIKTAMESVEMSIEQDHPFTKPLHPDYLENIKLAEGKVLLLLHDKHGNLNNSTYYYLALKINEIYEVVSSFLEKKTIRKLVDDIADEEMFYLTHRNLMRHYMGYYLLEFYMTLLYKSREHVMQTIDQYYPCNTRRSIIQCQLAKNNFDKQFYPILARVRQLGNEQTLYCEKNYYYTLNKKSGEDEKSEVSHNLETLKEMHRQQGNVCGSLLEYRRLLIAKNNFYLEHILPEELIKRNRSDLLL
ncbi:uncharacterized protein LOC103524789 isoform X2 [Diaphorina citri]|uniref:Uncharacterized protein LOC103524789 isoform X2 n=1 Tax=Diaphorina citri TaxID=121845 RepID=A0A1S3DVZ8_DIACI|nr:uncharacterized protein LOC103524789 isoform X2 [Diaphorina citri]